MTFPAEPEDIGQGYGDGQLQDGIALARLGEREQARAIFRRIIQQNPEHEQAWLWLAWAAEDREEARRYLEEARVILPTSPRIAEALRWAADATADVQRRERRTPRVDRQAQPRVLASRERLAAAMAQGRNGVSAVRRALGRLGSAVARTAPSVWKRARGWHLPPVSRARLAAFLGPALSLVTVAALVLGIGAIRRTVQANAARVLAETLPTPALNATPLPSVDAQLGPLWQQASLAATMGDWAAAVDTLLQIRALDPENDRVRRELAVAAYNDGLRLCEQNALDEARARFDLAVRADASCPGLLEDRRVLSLYLRGLDAYWTKDWDAVVSNLSKVQRLRPGFKDTAAMLGQGYYEVGVALQSERKWFEAVDAMNAALALLPDHAEAPLRLAELQTAITPPRRIEVSLSEFTATIYEDNQPVHTFPICHGRRSAPTLPGRYEVKSKMPMAYGSAWDLQMPYWLGLYDAGGSENGFHALPILSSGAVLWGQAIGTQCSYGCLVLNTADAEYLYNWADIGTVVYINR